MNFDSNLKLEIISSLFGQILTHYDKSQGKCKNILSVDEFHIQNLTGKRKSHMKGLCIDVDEFFDTDFDCDFRNLSDSHRYMRGDEPYDRPVGWYRMALKVKGKYPDGDAWLGTKGQRKHSVCGEWPVSYHGTSIDGAKGIIRSHYKAGERALYGRGIYSTPDINVAEREEYAKTFESKTTGKRYKMILQNRINPQKRQICPRWDYWLVPIRKGASVEEERETVESSIRPYGILIKEINDAGDDGDDENIDGEDYNDQYDDSGDSNGFNEDDDDEDDDVDTNDDFEDCDEDENDLNEGDVDDDEDDCNDDDGDEDENDFSEGDVVDDEDDCNDDDDGVDDDDVDTNDGFEDYDKDENDCDDDDDDDEEDNNSDDDDDENSAEYADGDIDTGEYDEDENKDDCNDDDDDDDDDNCDIYTDDFDGGDLDDSDGY